MKFPSWKTIFLSGFVLALFGLGAFYYLDFQQNRIIHHAICRKTGDDFVMVFKRPGLNKKRFEILNLRPGLISIAAKTKMNDVVLVTTEDDIVKTEKKSGNLFQLSLANNLIVSSIRLIPKSTSISSVDVVISRKPIISVPFVLFQFAFLFVICLMALLTIRVLCVILFKQPPLQDLPLNGIVFQFVILIAVLFVFIASHLGEFMNQFGLFHFAGGVVKAASFNLILTAVLTALFYLFSLKRKGEKLPLLLAGVACLPVLAVRIPFETKASADSLLWILNLSGHNPEISFAESFSLMLNKFVFGFSNLFANVGAKAILITTGKAMGVLFIFSLLFFVNSFSGFSYKKKLLFFLLFFSFSFSVLLFGFPEFRYYALPFLIFSFVAAKKYMADDNKNEKYLPVAAFLAAAAGLFHGTAYFSFPVILFLPLLKGREASGGKKISFYLRQYALIILAVLILASAFIILIKMSGFNIAFNTTKGGFDGRQFISFIPKNIHFPYAVVFLEISYFLSRGWIMLISGSFIFLLFIWQWRKKVSLSKSDLILLLFGLSQFLIILFWGFDNGVREVDLYLVPPTFMYLLLIRYLLETMRSEKSAWKYIIVFSLLSPIYPLLTKVI